MKRLFKSIPAPVLLSFAIVALDAFMVWGAENAVAFQLDASRKPTFADNLAVFLRDTILVGSLLASLVYLAGRLARYLLIAAFGYITLAISITQYGARVWKMDLAGNWLVLLLSTNTEEAKRFLFTLGGGGGGCPCVARHPQHYCGIRRAYGNPLAL